MTLTGRMRFQPEKCFQQIIVGIVQHSVLGTEAAAMPQNAGRRFVTRKNRRQVAVDDRLHDALSRLAVIRFAARLGEAKQSACKNHGGRRVSVPEKYSLVVEVVPGN